MLDILNTYLTFSSVLATNRDQKIRAKVILVVRWIFPQKFAFLMGFLCYSGPMVIQRTDKRFQLAGIISWGKIDHVFIYLFLIISTTVCFQVSDVLSQTNQAYTPEYQNSVIGLIKYWCFNLRWEKEEKLPQNLIKFSFAKPTCCDYFN